MSGTARGFPSSDSALSLFRMSPSGRSCDGARSCRRRLSFWDGCDRTPFTKTPRLGGDRQPAVRHYQPYLGLSNRSTGLKPPTSRSLLDRWVRSSPAFHRRPPAGPSTDDGSMHPVRGSLRIAPSTNARAEKGPSTSSSTWSSGGFPVHGAISVARGQCLVSPDVPVGRREGPSSTATRRDELDRRPVCRSPRPLGPPAVAVGLLGEKT